MCVITGVQCRMYLLLRLLGFWMACTVYSGFGDVAEGFHVVGLQAIFT